MARAEPRKSRNIRVQSKGICDQRDGDPQIDKMTKDLVELSESVRDCIAPLSEDVKKTLEDYHNLSYGIFGENIRHISNGPKSIRAFSF